MNSILTADELTSFVMTVAGIPDIAADTIAPADALPFDHVNAFSYDSITNLLFDYLDITEPGDVPRNTAEFIANFDPPAARILAKDHGSGYSDANV